MRLGTCADAAAAPQRGPRLAFSLLRRLTRSKVQHVLGTPALDVGRHLQPGANRVQLPEPNEASNCTIVARNG